MSESKYRKQPPSRFEVGSHGGCEASLSSRACGPRKFMKNFTKQQLFFPNRLVMFFDPVRVQRKAVA
jgi:hypothetical protein